MTLKFPEPVISPPEMRHVIDAWRDDLREMESWVPKPKQAPRGRTGAVKSSWREPILLFLKSNPAGGSSRTISIAIGAKPNSISQVIATLCCDGLVRSISKAPENGRNSLIWQAMEHCP